MFPASNTPTICDIPACAEQAAAVERERLRQEAEAARHGTLFVQVRQKSGDQSAPEPAVAGPTTPPNPFAPLPGSAETARPDEATSQNGQDRKSAFLTAATDTRIYASGRLQTPASPFQVMAGTIIPAAMVTGLNSDLPGQAIATVSRKVRSCPSTWCNFGCGTGVSSFRQPWV